MHHVALNGAGPDDGDFNHQIIKHLRLHARQHVHLRPAFNLKHPDGVGFLHHLINRCVLTIHRGKVIAFAFMLADEIKSLADAGEHAQRQNIHLHHAQRVNVVLVPFDEEPVLHGGGANGHTFIQTVLCQHKTPHMLRQVTRKTHKVIGGFHRPRHHGVGRVQPALKYFPFLDATAPTAPHTAGQIGRHVIRQPEHFSRLANGTAGPVADHRRRQGRMGAAITLVDVLDHFLPPLMFKIHVNIGWLPALFADEAFKQQINLHGVHSGNAQHIADSRIGSRTTALAENVLTLGKAHNIMNGQKIGRNLHLGDERQFLLQRRLHLVWNACGITLIRASPRQFMQMLLR